jgi:ABC-type branched-subunit amino acid transport system substrate-binding protein
MQFRITTKAAPLSAAVGLAIALAACSSASTSSTSASTSSGSTSGTSTSGAKGDYVIGFEGGLTGPVAPTPADELLGLRAYMNMINKKGGINGHMVNVVSANDDGLDASTAVANFINFRDSVKPSVVVGPTVSNITDAIASIVDAADIPTLVTSPTPQEEQDPYVYAVDIRFDQEANIEVQVVKSLDAGGSKARVAILYADSAAGESMGTAGDAAIAANGWTLTSNILLPVPPPDSMAPQAQTIVSKNTQYVIGGVFLDLPPLLMTSLATDGFKGVVVNYHGGATLPQLMQINDPNYYVLRSWAYYNSPAPGVQAMDAAVRAIGGDPSGDYLPIGWGSGALIAKALAACGFPCPGSKMKTELDSVGTVGTLGGVFAGPFGFVNGSHQAVNASNVYHYVNGKVEELPTTYTVQS